jgi:hypothetical protein
MDPQAYDGARAYTYAWWLAGDEAAAERALRDAVERSDVRDRPSPERLEALLRAVRTNAAPQRTMCPASEVALLHDGHGLPLDVAAGLAAVDPDDARTELAHGRLEALLGHAGEPFVHPERLGGLAVGNPADVAHARQCDSCERARELLARGRDELRDLPVLEPPPDLRALWPGADGPDDAPAPQRGGDDDGPASRSAARTLVGSGCIAAAIVLLLVYGSATRTRATDAAQASQDPVVAAPATTEPATPTPSAPPPPPAPTPAQTSGVVQPDVPFTILGAGVVPPGGGAPALEGLVVGAAQPLAFAVDYEGAATGVALVAHWTVGGAPFRELLVVLASARDTHRFGAPVPPEGWPLGAHELTLVVDDDPREVIRFTVTADA